MDSNIPENEYVIKTPQLCKALGVTRMTLWSWEQRGYFTPPRVGNRGDRRFTLKQVREIIKAFGPTGKRQWHFES